MKIFLLFLLLTNSISQAYAQEEPKYYNSEEHLNRNPPYSEAVRLGNTLYVSGQVGLTDDGNIVEGGIVEETRLSLNRIKRILEKYGSSMDKVVKCTCILSDINDFQKMSDTYRTFFPKNKLPARTTFAGQVALGGKIEIDCIAKSDAN